MKIERLYAITVYLLNHGRTSANRLAAHFEVSLRTIQRDMESLCLSGIPVISIPGASGGYEISRQFQLDHQLATADDYAFIKTALQGLVSATGDPGAKQALEKIANVSKPSDNGIILDFSVLQEGNTALLQILQSAISKKRALRFTYTNNNQETRSHCVEPVAVVYRWYAWYLLAYSRVKGDYRTYKLVRMQDLVITVYDVAEGRPVFGMSKGGGEMPWYVHELPVIGISVNAPTMLADVPTVRTYINAYDSMPHTMDALAEKLLTGPEAFTGKDPIDSFCGMWDTRI